MYKVTIDQNSRLHSLRKIFARAERFATTPALQIVIEELHDNLIQLMLLANATPLNDKQYNELQTYCTMADRLNCSHQCFNDIIIQEGHLN